MAPHSPHIHIHVWYVIVWGDPLLLQLPEDALLDVLRELLDVRELRLYLGNHVLGPLIGGGAIGGAIGGSGK